jgi:hypothetical protein
MTAICSHARQVEAPMVDAKVRYLIFLLLVAVGVFLPAANAIRVPFLWFGLGGISDELHLSQESDLQIMMREIEEAARNAQRARDLEILKELHRQIEALPTDSGNPIIM